LASTPRRGRDVRALRCGLDARRVTDVELSRRWSGACSGRVAESGPAGRNDLPIALDPGINVPGQRGPGESPLGCTIRLRPRSGHSESMVFPHLLRGGTPASGLSRDLFSSGAGAGRFWVCRERYTVPAFYSAIGKVRVIGSSASLQRVTPRWPCSVPPSDVSRADRDARLPELGRGGRRAR